MRIGFFQAISMGMQLKKIFEDKRVTLYEVAKFLVYLCKDMGVPINHFGMIDIIDNAIKDKMLDLQEVTLIIQKVCNLKNIRLE